MVTENHLAPKEPEHICAVLKKSILILDERVKLLALNKKQPRSSKERDAPNVSQTIRRELSIAQPPVIVMEITPSSNGSNSYSNENRSPCNGSSNDSNDQRKTSRICSNESNSSKKKGRSILLILTQPLPFIFIPLIINPQLLLISLSPQKNEK